MSDLDMESASVSEALRLLDAAAAGDVPYRGTLRFPYEVGLLARREFAVIVAFGRAVGLTVTIHNAGGWLVQRGYMVVAGGLAELRRFLEAWQRLEIASRE